MKHDLIRMIEAFYEPIEDPKGWLTHVARAVDPFLGAGLGTQAWTYTDDDVARSSLPAIGTYGLGSEQGMAYAEAASPSDRSAIFAAVRTAPSLTLRGVDPTLCAKLDAGLAGNDGVRMLDAVIMNGWNPDGSGISVGSGRDSVVELTPELRGRIDRAAAHLASALRLRGLDAGQRASLDRADAVLSPDGGLLHAGTTEAASEESREALRRAAQGMDRARGRLRRDAPDDALASWTSLVNGRFTLVDAFDTDGRRFLVARVNEPKARGPEGLSPRELQVVAFRAAGHSSKLIAYELGLSEPTVSRELRRAMQKLGVRTSVELVKALERDAPTPEA